uniref:Uncharacterized protein n=1 Tax=Anguilla anguilla TaxID=7936 RepID=A0A0E9VA04_ANGAN
MTAHSDFRSLTTPTQLQYKSNHRIIVAQGTISFSEK